MQRNHHPTHTAEVGGPYAMSSMHCLGPTSIVLAASHPQEGLICAMSPPWVSVLCVLLLVDSACLTVFLLMLGGACVS